MKATAKLLGAKEVEALLKALVEGLQCDWVTLSPPGNPSRCGAARLAANCPACQAEAKLLGHIAALKAGCMQESAASPHGLLLLLAAALDGRVSTCTLCQEDERTGQDTRPHFHQGSRRTLARALSTSESQVDRLLAGGADWRWSTVERVAQALGTARGQAVEARLVLVDADKGGKS